MPSTDRSSVPSDGQLVRRAFALAATGLLGVTAAVWASRAAQASPGTLDRLTFPEAPEIETEVGVLEPVRLTDAQRQRGFNECTPLDPIGLGPYRPYRNVRWGGRMLIPQRGGHTDDMGFDVLVHFHGHEPLRKTLVQVSRGMVFVGYDKGINSGPYSTPFQRPGLFPKILESVEKALRKDTGDERAHIRHLGLSAWSAGYGAVNRIVERYSDRIDAVVLLDGLHASRNAAKPRSKGYEALSSSKVQPIFDYARRALDGDEIFVFTHSDIDPVTYPSTRQTADLLLHDLGVEQRSVPAGGDHFPMKARFDRNGVHVWSYAGHDQAAHCDHISHIAEVLTTVLEPAWDTPTMDRDVPPTPAPVLGGDAGGEAPLLEVVTVGTEDEPGKEPAGLPSEPLAAPAAAIAEGPSLWPKHTRPHDPLPGPAAQEEPERPGP